MPACVNCEFFDAKNRACLSVRRWFRKAFSKAPSDWTPVENHALLRSCTDAAIHRYSAQVHGNVLEIGCGKAATFRHKVAANPRVENWWVSDPRSRYEGNPNFVLCGVGYIPFKHNWFDWICGFECVEHWNESGDSIEQGLKEIHRVLKPGGHLVLTMPIYLHGAEMFYFGLHRKIKEELMKYVDWTRITFEDWRRDYHPLPPIENWKWANYTKQVLIDGKLRAKTHFPTEADFERMREEAYQKDKKPSTWHVQMHAIK